MPELYREIILDYYANPRNKGAIEKRTHTAVDWNPLCGDKIKFDLKIDSKGKVEEAKFNGDGCAISQASASMLTERIEGLSTAQISKLNEKDILALVGMEISPGRKKCALLGLFVVRKALGLKPILSK